MANKIWIGTLIAILPLFLFMGCSSSSTTKGTGGSAKHYTIKGKVTALDTKKPAITLDHEDIPGLMKAMEMTFDVKDAQLLNGLKVGDEVQGELEKSPDGYVITHLEKR
jgi:protein SCO1/2